MTPHSRRPARGRLSALGAALLLLTAAGCTGSPAAETDPARAEGSAEAPAERPVTIMGAGDIAGHREAAAATAALIVAADPDAVFTAGDNAYPGASTRSTPRSARRALS